MNPPEKPSVPNYISFTFSDKTSIKSFNNETIRELVGIIKSTPTVDKKNAYFIVENQVVFLENVDSIKWHLVEEEME